MMGGHKPIPASLLHDHFQPNRFRPRSEFKKKDTGRLRRFQRQSVSFGKQGRPGSHRTALGIVQSPIDF